MAQKRMFSAKVVETDRFLEMPTSAQCLYFHLGMHGDDDGFVSSPRKITSMCGCNPDDLRILITKKFIYPFKSGVCVITDWRVNNTLKNDRYTPTIYTDEKSVLEAFEKGECVLEPVWNQIGTSLEPQHNITKHNITKRDSSAAKPRETEQLFNAFWEAYPKKKDKKNARKAFDKAIKHTDLDTMLAALEKQRITSDWQRDGGQFIPYPATWLNGERWADDLTDSGMVAACTVLPDLIPDD